MATTSRESFCDVSIVRGEDLMIHTPTAVACEVIKKIDGEQYDKQHRPNHARERVWEDCESSGIFQPLNMLLQVLVLAGHGDEEIISATRILSKHQRHWLQFFLIRCVGAGSSRRSDWRIGE